MKRLIELLTTIIPFLNPYPFWVKLIIAIWIIGLAAIIVILIFAYPTNISKNSTKDKSSVKSQTNIDKVEGDYVAGDKHVYEIRKEVTLEEKQALSPKINIKLCAYPESLPTRYKYPLKQYSFTIQNLNKESAPIYDFRIKFIFKNVLEEIKPMPLLRTGGHTSVAGMKIYTENKNGSTNWFEEQPLETPITKNFSLVIQKAKVNDMETNTNIAIFNCERWPEGTAFSADIIVNLEKIGYSADKITYSGIYYYKIKDKTFEEKINGVIK